MPTGTSCSLPLQPFSLAVLFDVLFIRGPSVSAIMFSQKGRIKGWFAAEINIKLLAQHARNGRPIDGWNNGGLFAQIPPWSWATRFGQLIGRLGGSWCAVI